MARITIHRRNLPPIVADNVEADVREHILLLRREAEPGAMGEVVIGVNARDWTHIEREPDDGAVH